MAGIGTAVTVVKALQVLTERTTCTISLPLTGLEPKTTQNPHYVRNASLSASGIAHRLEWPLTLPGCDISAPSQAALAPRAAHPGLFYIATPPFWYSPRQGRVTLQFCPPAHVNVWLQYLIIRPLYFMVLLNTSLIHCHQLCGEWKLGRARGEDHQNPQLTIINLV